MQNRSRTRPRREAAALLVFLVAASACSTPEPAPEAPAPSRLAGAPEVPPAPAPAEPAGWVGVVVPNDAVELAADRAGRLEAVLVEVGDAVAPGMPVARLDVQEVRQELRMAEAALRRAEAEAASAEAEVTRARTRLERRTAMPELVSREELAEVEAESATARAARDAAEALLAERRAAVEQLRIRLERSALRAPFGGRVARRYLDAGATVAPGDPVVRLATTEAVKIRFAVPPEDAAALAPGAVVTVASDAGEPLSTAAVLRVAPEIDPVSQQVLVEALPDGAGAALHAGLAVRLSPRPSSGGGEPS